MKIPIALWLLGCGADPPVEGPSGSDLSPGKLVSIVFQSRVEGEIEPCG